MKGVTADVQQHRLMLTEVTEAQCNAAVSVIAAHAIDRDDLVMLLDAIRPTPHTPSPSPAKRRAEPRHTR